MNINLYKISILFFILLLFSNCKKEAIKSYEISGIVYSVSENETPDEKKTASDVKVSINGTELITYTDADGKFSFVDIQYSDISEGIEFITVEYIENGNSTFKEDSVIYLNFSKGGFPDIKNRFKIFSSSFFLANDIILYEPSSTEVSSDFSITEIDKYGFNFTISVLQEATNDFRRGVAVIIGNTENVSFDNNVFCKPFIIDSGNEISSRILKGDMSYIIPDFSTNKTYYAVAYGISENFDHFGYYDHEKQSPVWIGLNETPSNVISFQISSE